MSCRDEGVGGFLAIDKDFLGLWNLMGARFRRMLGLHFSSVLRTW